MKNWQAMKMGHWRSWNKEAVIRWLSFWRVYLIIIKVSCYYIPAVGLAAGCA